MTYAGVVGAPDPLSAAEIARAVTTIRDHFAWGDDLRVETIDIDEPAKEVVRRHQPDDPADDKRK